MATAPLKIFRDTPFDPSTEVDLVDVFTGNGSQTTFVLSNKSGQRLASTITFDSTQYYQYNGGFTKTDTDFTLSSAPPANSQGVAPGVSYLGFSAFDTDDVDGVTNPRINEVAFYVGDPYNIHLSKYENLPNLQGIELSFVDLVSSSGAEISWVQLACATQDAAGTALTYSATGTSLYTVNINAFGTLASSAVAGGTSLICGTASSFYVGDYIFINKGGGTQEIKKITAYNGQFGLTVTALDFAHSPGETVYACARKFWAKMTVPSGVSGGTPTNFYDLGLRLRGLSRSRL
jgi:hypothetical protein